MYSSHPSNTIINFFFMNFLFTPLQYDYKFFFMNFNKIIIRQLKCNIHEKNHV